MLLFVDFVIYVIYLLKIYFESLGFDLLSFEVLQIYEVHSFTFRIEAFI